MKKTYIIPVSKVHNLASRDAVLQSTSTQGLSTSNTATQKSEEERENNGNGDNDARRFGSTNIWSEEW